MITNSHQSTPRRPIANPACSPPRGIRPAVRYLHPQEVPMSLVRPQRPGALATGLLHPNGEGAACDPREIAPPARPSRNGCRRLRRLSLRHQKEQRRRWGDVRRENPMVPSRDARLEDPLGCWDGSPEGVCVRAAPGLVGRFRTRAWSRAWSPRRRLRRCAEAAGPRRRAGRVVLGQVEVDPSTLTTPVIVRPSSY